MYTSLNIVEPGEEQDYFTEEFIEEDNSNICVCMCVCICVIILFTIVIIKLNLII
jgi:hypothetical protein